jgi:hypothetical protein
MALRTTQFRMDVIHTPVCKAKYTTFFTKDYDCQQYPAVEVSGDWFDVCKCNIPCPCTYAQTPFYGDCNGVLAYHIKIGQYGQTPLNGLNVLVLSYFKGNIWAGETKASLGIFFDEKANQQQREGPANDFQWKSWRIYG